MSKSQLILTENMNIDHQARQNQTLHNLAAAHLDGSNNPARPRRKPQVQAMILDLTGGSVYVQSHPVLRRTTSGHIFQDAPVRGLQLPQRPVTSGGTDTANIYVPNISIPQVTINAGPIKTHSSGTQLCTHISVQVSPASQAQVIEGGWGLESDGLSETLGKPSERTSNKTLTTRDQVRLKTTPPYELRRVGGCYSLRSEALRNQHATAKRIIPRHTPHGRYLHGEASRPNPLSNLSSQPSSEANENVTVRGRSHSDVLTVELRLHFGSIHCQQENVQGTAVVMDMGSAP